MQIKIHKIIEATGMSQGTCFQFSMKNWVGKNLKMGAAFALGEE